MAETLEMIAAQVKANIMVLINENRFQQAQHLLNQYMLIVGDDAEAFSIQAVIYISDGRLAEAITAIKSGLVVDRKNFDLLYNLAYIFEVQQEYAEAVPIYRQLLAGEGYTVQQQAIAQEALARIKEYSPDIELNRKKMVFFVKPAMDSFIGDIIDGLSGLCEIKKIIVTDGRQIEEGMQWADVCWFDWCDDLIIYASKLKIAKDKKIICRLHSYEAFTDWPEQVNWSKVDSFIIDSEHIKKVVLSRINIPSEKISMIPVGINDEKFTFKSRKNGFNVAFVGYINFKKGPMLLIHLLDALVKKDSRYTLHICGQFQDHRYILYFEQMIKELKLENNLKYNGRVESVDDWLDDKDYILSTSLLEGQHITVMEGMCKGLKPIIHNFVGAKQLYKDCYVWNTIDEAVEMISAEHYASSEYRKFIVDNYSNEQQIKKIKQILKGLK